MKRKRNKRSRTKLCWASMLDISSVEGNNFGYYNLMLSLKTHASLIMDTTQEAEDVLITTAPEFFDRKISGKKNWLYTMFEGSIPNDYLENVRKADRIIVPTQWVKKLFDDSLKGDVPVSVVPCGVSHKFKFKKRTFPTSKPFRFLWVGAPNPRKGWEEIIYAWKDLGLFRESGVELYIKTTGVKAPKGLPNTLANVTIDNRKLSGLQMVKLYQSAHCFLFPTRGEGFGFTLAEAMATGCPCIASYYSGLVDFFDEEVGFPIYQMTDFTTSIRNMRTGKEYDVDIKMPNVQEMVDQMFYVYDHYTEALDRGLQAHRRIKRDWTWGRAAKRLKEVIEEG